MFRFSYRVLALTAGLAVLAAGCGGDDDDDDDDIMQADAMPGTPDAPAQLCPSDDHVTETSGTCALAAPDTDPITDDIHLVAGVDYVLDGPVWIGDDSNETVLTIDPGVHIYGGDGSFLLIQRGSKIEAVGTAADPIVMTSAKAVGSRGASDWGGLVINGKAPINNADMGDGSAPGEAGTGRYGGNTSADDSGTLKYLRVEFAGNLIDAENELNGIAFQGVGSGTTVDFVQVHMASDDTIEFFGGTVQAKHLVLTGGDDDSFDWTGGFSGKAQFVVAQQLADSGSGGERGIEADNLEGDHSATPNSNPTLSNFTIIASPGNAAQGMELRRGTEGSFHNFVVTGFDGPCIRITDAETGQHVTDGDLTVDNFVFDCDGGTIVDGTGVTGAAAKLLNDGNTTEGDPKLTDWMPASDSPALGIGSGPSDSFFDDVDYAGAFDGTTDWTAGWIETATK